MGGRGADDLEPAFPLQVFQRTDEISSMPPEQGPETGEPLSPEIGQRNQVVRRRWRRARPPPPRRLARRWAKYASSSSTNTGLASWLASTGVTPMRDRGWHTARAAAARSASSSGR